jgi:ketosteroid isomerase-like protein
MSESDSIAVIERFYSAFARKDYQEMAACYLPQVRFSDPAFGELDGDEARAMWHMFCERGEDLTVSFRDVQAWDERGSAHWDADYTFSATGRPVHNEIEARFKFRDGLIAEHRDSFDFWRWSRQALGPAGLALGWTPLVRRKVRSQARGTLREYMAATDANRA